MPLPARLAPVLLSVGDPAPNDGWNYTIESLIGVIELPTANVNLIPLITPLKKGFGIIERRSEIDVGDIIIDGDVISIETEPLFPNVMASDTTRQIGGAYLYTLVLRGDDPRCSAWTYHFRFILDGDASYTLVGTAIPVAQVSSIDPVDPLNPEWVALESAVAALQGLGHVPEGGTLGQTLAKASATDYDTEWVTTGAGSDKHDQTSYVASATWSRVHNMNKRPAVSMVDASGVEIFGTIDHVSINEVLITFASPQTGDLILN
jgi:hypothetical protein